MLADALEKIKGVDGYRFTQETSWLGAPRRVGGERVWTRTRSQGAYLAPDRYREEVVSTTNLLPDTGFWEAVGIGERAWWLWSDEPDGPREWMEVPPDPNGGNV